MKAIGRRYRRRMRAARIGMLLLALTGLPLILTTALVVGLTLHAYAQQPAPPQMLMGMPLLFSEDFEAGSAARWEPGDPKAWRVIKVGDTHVYNQHQQSDVKPAVRSPFNQALVKELSVTDFVLEARLQSTAREYGHRDLCLFFGYQDASHLYYVHLAKQADPHANSIFLVNGAPRVSIAKTRTEGTEWGDAWHRVRVVRKVMSGSIEVYFDDMQKPVMTAEDKTLAWGRVGIGSFDDTGSFDDVRVWGVRR